MKFTIEVVRAVEGGAQDVLHRATIDEISPRRAKTKADLLRSVWLGRGATVVRVLNPRGEELYSAR
ncbi:MAG: hypothetical protein WA776_22320 [Xanthobacteraceae bacterium]